MKFIKFFNVFILFAYFSVNAYSSASCELITYNTKCVVSAGKLIVEKEYLLQINDRSGDKFTKIQIPYTDGDNLKITEAQIENLSGSVIRKIKGQQIKTRSLITDIALYRDDFVKYFSLQHTQYPYRIRYSYKQVVDKFIYITNWSPVFDVDIPTHSASLVLQVPSGYPIKLNVKNIDEANKRIIGGIIEYKWQSSYLDQIMGERFSPPLSECIPNVTVVPEKFWYGKNGSTESWQLFGNWIYKLTDGLNELPENDKHLVNQIKKNNPDTLSIIKELYKHLQNKTRYVFVKIDIGGLKPYSAEYVSQNGYGDCKALTNYMKSLLDYAGIKSYYTVVQAGDNPSKVNIDFPSQQFNHVILSIPRKDTLWLECTSDLLPCNYLGTFTQNRKALIADEQNSRLVNTPLLTLDDVHSISNYEFDIDFLGNTSLKLKYSFHGPDFERFESFRQNYSESEKEKIIKYVFPLSSFRLKSWDVIRADEDKPKIELMSNMEVDGYTKNYGDNIIFDVISSSIPDFEKPDERALPVRINYPINETDSIIYNLPSGYKVDVVPDNFKLESRYGSYKVEYKQSGNKILLVKNFTLFRGDYEISEYQDFYNHMNKVYVSEKNKTIMLTKI